MPLRVSPPNDSDDQKPPQITQTRNYEFTLCSLNINLTLLIFVI